VPKQWITRDFASDADPALLPNIIERLRGTPARIEERVGRLHEEILTCQPSGAWSIQENVGHLLDLEPLWTRRVAEFEAGAKVLSAADMSNQATVAARHNDRPMDELLRDFRRARGVLVSAFERVPEPVQSRTALHPRLQKPMRLVDLAVFIAEHDDHHLARITALLSVLGGG